MLLTAGFRNVVTLCYNVIVSQLEARSSCKDVNGVCEMFKKKRELKLSGFTDVITQVYPGK